MNKQGHWWNSNWTIGIVCALIPLVIDFFRKVPILTTFKNIFSWLFELLTTILTFNIKVWWLICGAIVLLLVRKIKLASKTEINTEPQFDPDKYTSDQFKNWKWSWRWTKYGRTSRLDDLTAHCPKCDTHMTEDYLMSDYYTCPRCNFSSDRYHGDTKGTVSAIVLDNVKNKKSPNQRF